MAKNVRISDALYALAQAEARMQDRSIAQQLEHWAKRGMAAVDRQGTEEVTVVDAARAMTRRLDELDVREGRRRPDYLYFIPRSLARQAVATFPATYRKD